MSGVEIGASWVRKGAVDAILNYLNGSPAAVGSASRRCARVSADTARESGDRR